MSKKNGNGGTPTLAVSRLFGRCLTVTTVDGETFEVKVMGERTVATARREQLIAALVAGGALEVKTMTTVATKGDD